MMTSIWEKLFIHVHLICPRYKGQWKSLTRKIIPTPSKYEEKSEQKFHYIRNSDAWNSGSQLFSMTPEMRLLYGRPPCFMSDLGFRPFSTQRHCQDTPIFLAATHTCKNISLVLIFVDLQFALFHLFWTSRNSFFNLDH